MVTEDIIKNQEKGVKEEEQKQGVEEDEEVNKSKSERQ